MEDSFLDGMGAMFGLLLALFIVVFLGVQMHNCANELSHIELGSQGHACFANKTCREYLKCVDDGSKSGICVK